MYYNNHTLKIQDEKTTSKKIIIKATKMEVKYILFPYLKDLKTAKVVTRLAKGNT